MARQIHIAIKAHATAYVCHLQAFHLAAGPIKPTKWRSLAVIITIASMVMTWMLCLVMVILYSKPSLCKPLHAVPALCWYSANPRQILSNKVCCSYMGLHTAQSRRNQIRHIVGCKSSHRCPTANFTESCIMNVPFEEAGNQAEEKLYDVSSSDADVA